MAQAARKDKRALVADKLQLTPAEAKKFWPVYDNLQKELTRLNRERNVALEVLANRDRPPSDVYAKQVVNDLMSIEEQEVKAMRKAANASMKALPPRKAARYMQIENKLRATQDYEIAVAFPLVQ
jgi:Spy/CpxP family protein refolding chaperone